MELLTNALTEVLAAEPVEWMSEADREDRLLRLRRTIDVLEAEAARTLVTFDERREFRRDGYSSTTAYLKHRCRVTGGRAKRFVEEARALDSMPITKKLFQSGELSHDHVRVLVGAFERAPEAFSADEAMLCGFADDLPFVRQFRTAVAYWENAAADRRTTDEAQRARRALYASRTLDGMVRIDGWLDSAAGDEFLGALDTVTPPPATDDDRTPAQRRADGLMDVVRSGAAALAGEAASLLVHVNLETLTGAGATLAETNAGTVLPPSAVERISCDAALARVVFDGQSRPIELGRSKRLISPAQRLALVARDRHCRFKGCDRPAGWCDGHHIVHWSYGGATDLDNLVLLCRHHHTLVHETDWRIRGSANDLIIERPDRSVLRSPP